MGMFDYVNITCPHCDKVTEYQTKAFECILQRINLDEEQSLDVASHFEGEWHCKHCEGKFLVSTGLPEHIKLKTMKIY